MRLPSRRTARTSSSARASKRTDTSGPGLRRLTRSESIFGGRTSPTLWIFKTHGAFRADLLVELIHSRAPTLVLRLELGPITVALRAIGLARLLRKNDVHDSVRVGAPP